MNVGHSSGGTTPNERQCCFVSAERVNKQLCAYVRHVNLKGDDVSVVLTTCWSATLMCWLSLTALIKPVLYFLYPYALCQQQMADTQN